MRDGQGLVSLKRYAGGFTYLDPDGSGSASETLDFFAHSAGRVKYYGGGQGADRVAYAYAFTDPLGNTRLLVDPDGAGIMQASAYYPYGLRIGGLHQGLVDATGPSTNEGLYNGKELTDAHGLNGYHYGARFYDVEIARWTTMDPADEFHTPYTYVGGDPVNLVDPDGRVSQPPEDVIITGSKSEKRYLRRRIHTMRKLSPRFNSMYKKLDQSSTVYTVSIEDLSELPVPSGVRALGAFNPKKGYRSRLQPSTGNRIFQRPQVSPDIKLMSVIFYHKLKAVDFRLIQQ